MMMMRRKKKKSIYNTEEFLSSGTYRTRQVRDYQTVTILTSVLTGNFFVTASILELPN
jgi:hypothetical protein